MRKWLVVAVTVSVLCPLPAGRAGAEPRTADNDGVVLYLSFAPELVYHDTTSYRGLSATPFPEEAIVTSEPASRPQVAFILASYPPEATPELTVVSFGVRYDPGIRVLRYGITPESLQMATRDWPLSGEGMMLGLTTDPDTSTVVEVGWVAIQADKPGRFDLVPHPDPRMAARVVCQSPPGMVPVASLGWLGFGRGGHAPEPVRPGPQVGATCVRDTLCYELTRQEAAYYRDLLKGRSSVVFLGENVRCVDAHPCAEDALEGACCLPDGGCVMMTRKNCIEADGDYHGDGSLCEPDPCTGERSGGDEEGGP